MGVTLSVFFHVYSFNIYKTHASQESTSFAETDKFPVGTKVQAVWSEDGEWYAESLNDCPPS